MTLKLLKYDIRSAFRTMWMFWVAAPIIALLVAFVKWGYTRVDLFNDVLSFAGGVVKGATGIKEVAECFKDAGVQYIAYSVDYGIFLNASKALIEKLKGSIS